MESTAQYWRPVWEALRAVLATDPSRCARAPGPTAGTLHLAQAQSNRAPGGRKKDFPDAERLVKRLVAQELTLSFVPDVDAAPVADGDAPQVPAHVQPGAAPEPAGVPAGRSSHQAVEPGVGSVRGERSSDAAGGGRVAKPIRRRWRRSGSQRLRATPAQLSDALGACCDLDSGLPAAAGDDARRIAI